MPGPNTPYTQLSADQAITQAFDEATDRLRVDAEITASIAADLQVEIDAADGDNIAISNADGSKQVTVTTLGAKEALDVNVGDIAVTLADPNTPANQLAIAADGTISVNVANITISKDADSIATESVDQSTRIDEVTSALSYFGFAAVGGSEASAIWKIKRLSVTGTVTKIEYADSNSDYDNIWANRASLLYG